MDNKSIELKNELDKKLTSIFNPEEPGAYVLVSVNGKPIYSRGFGIADVVTKKPLDESTMFNICSLSKQFSAVAILKLAEQGLLTLDDPITKYFPNLTKPFFKKITLRNFLNHTSGLPDSRPRNNREWSDYIKKHPTRFENVRDYILFSDEEESWYYLEDLEHLNFEPGTEYEYMNPTFQMVLEIVQQVTGENFDNWMKENVFSPAGMKHTVYFEPNRVIETMAHAYDLAEGENKYDYVRSADDKWEECDYGEAGFFVTKADGGIYSSPAEFNKWNEAVFNDRIISTQSRETAHTPNIKTDLPYTDYGLGWFIENKPGFPEKIFHTGDNGGFKTFEGYFPEKNLFYLIFANQPQWNREELIEQIDEIFKQTGFI